MAAVSVSRPWLTLAKTPCFISLLDDVVALDAQATAESDLDGDRLFDLDRLALLHGGLGAGRAVPRCCDLVEVAIEIAAGGAGGVERIAAGDEIGFGEFAELFVGFAAPTVGPAAAS